MSWNTLHAAEHFVYRNARLIDRLRYAYHFQAGPVGPVHSALVAYRNVDGGYGNGLDPDLRGHGSQPLAIEMALRVLDGLGTIPRELADRVCGYLTSITRPDGGVPLVLANARHTEASPRWKEAEDTEGSLNPTATIAGLLHKDHLSHPWRDHATAFCWTRISALQWTEPHEAIAVCTFLQYAPERARARAELSRLAPMIRTVIAHDPNAGGRVHTPLDIAQRPDDISRHLFTDEEISGQLDLIQRGQRTDGGWPSPREEWCTAATLEWRGVVTLQRLLTLRAYGRI